MRVIPISELAKSVLEQLPRLGGWVVTARASRKYPGGGHQISERRLNTFRHVFISYALTRGTAEAIVRQWVGHVDRDILRPYTHIADTASQAAMQRLSRHPSPNLQPHDQEVEHASAQETESAQNQHKGRGGKNGRSAK